MIFVAGTMTINPAVIDAFAVDVAAMVDKVRAEAGCRHYSLLVEDAAAGLVNVHEQWDDDAALVMHLQQPWITAFFNRYGGEMQAASVRICDIAGERPLPGM